jgi:hypothetical protein
VALPHFHAQSCPGIPGVDRPHQQTHGAPCGGTTTGGWNPLDDREMYRTPLYFVGNTHGNTIGFHWFPLGKIYRKEFWPLKWSPVSGCNVRMSMVNSNGFGFLVWDENRIYAG